VSLLATQETMDASLITSTPSLVAIAIVALCAVYLATFRYSKVAVTGRSKRRKKKKDAAPQNAPQNATQSAAAQDNAQSQNPQDPPSSSLRHVGIVMDGNRRYGKAKYGPAGYLRGHADGGRKLEQCIQWCIDHRAAQQRSYPLCPPTLHTLTVYAFSSENFNRPKPELDGLWSIFTSQSHTLSKQCKDLNVRAVIVNTCGWDQFPASVADALKRIQQDTEECTGLTVNVCVGYSGSEDVCRAVEKMCSSSSSGSSGSKKKRAVAPEDILEHMSINTQIDLLIRTSGEMRLSNFALYNLAYAELLFVDKPWPEFTREDFVQAVENFERRDRRYGK
jgi:undecaprenyl diphosphate synthase